MTPHVVLLAKLVFSMAASNTFHSAAVLLDENMMDLR